LDKTGVNNKTLLIVISKRDQALQRAVRNIPNVRLEEVAQVNAYHVIKAFNLIMTEEAWKKYLETRCHVI
ncbi:50S ribosomal protein L4, partial [Elusimicrobiota bacterium]